MSDKQMDALADIISNYCNSIEDFERVESLVECLKENYIEELEEDE